MANHPKPSHEIAALHISTYCYKCRHTSPHSVHVEIKQNLKYKNYNKPCEKCNSPEFSINKIIETVWIDTEDNRF